jgi:transposase-like protein
MGDPQTLLEAVRYFSDLNVATKEFAMVRWPDGVTCPRCGSKEKHSYITTRRIYMCKSCRKQFSPKAGTIFEDSPLGMDKWMVAVWVLTNTKNGTSSHELRRSLGVTQKTAWFMLQRIRHAMTTGTFEKLSGEVEADETFIGQKARNMHKSVRSRKITGTGGKDKAMVVGLLERGGHVKATVVQSRKKKDLHKLVRDHVNPGAALFTDALKSYEGLDAEYVHQFVDHAVKYAEGKVHTNGLENFWSLLKRSIYGTYVSVLPFHLFRYVDEQAFRFNHRKENDGNRFRRALAGCGGRRLTYRKLTGKLETV